MTFTPCALARRRSLDSLECPHTLTPLCSEATVTRPETSSVITHSHTAVSPEKTEVRARESITNERYLERLEYYEYCTLQLSAAMLAHSQGAFVLAASADALLPLSR